MTKLQAKAYLYDKVRDLHAIYEYEVEEQYLKNQYYQWMDGNYACDDNRGDFVAQALGIPEPDYPCGHDKVVLEKLVIDGKFICKDGTA